MSGSDSFDQHIQGILDIYSSLSFCPPLSQYTILASFFLTYRETVKVISLATGTKCLPTAKLPVQGEALHDSHAEVLARRGAIRWFLEEIGRSHDTPSQSSWMSPTSEGSFVLREGVELNFYVSTVPCGDASMRFLASFQDEEMAALKNSNVFPVLPPNSASRGRDNYCLFGVLRTKPGRADSPPTMSMSCSDKIAAWNFLGIQGALAFRFFMPLYISNIIIGEVPENMQGIVLEDCERAFFNRLEGIRSANTKFNLHRPRIQFTSLQFPHSRTAVSLKASPGGSCNECICWVADSPKHDVLIHGVKRGVSPKHRLRETFRPKLSKIALFQLYHHTLVTSGLTSLSDRITYFAAKHTSTDYQAAKQAMTGNGGPFSGWVRSGAPWESFDLRGEIPHSSDSAGGEIEGFLFPSYT